MAVAYRSSGALVDSAIGTPAVPYPAGLAANDLLVIQFATGVSGVTPTTPGGWTKLFGPVAMAGGGNTNQGYVYYKIATGGESGTLTFANTGSSNHAIGQMSAYSGADTTTPINASATANLPTSGSTGTTPSVTTTVANCMLLRMYWDWSGTTTVTPAGTDTERYDSFNTNLNLAIEMADSTQAATGASGTTTATFPGSTTSGGMGATIAVAPAATSTTWNGSSTVSLTDTVTTAGTRLGVTTHGASVVTLTATVTTASRAATLHASTAVTETVTVTTRAALERMTLVPRAPGSLTLVPRPPDSLVLTPR